MKDFKKLKIWEQALKIGLQSYQIAKLLPSFERMFLGNQLCRSAISIASNIAEGSSRKSNKEYARYIEIAIGSAFELETQLRIAGELECSCKPLIAEALILLEEEVKMLHGFNRKLQATL